jgi:hypothetical protein
MNLGGSAYCFFHSSGWFLESTNGLNYLIEVGGFHTFNPDETFDHLIVFEVFEVEDLSADPTKLVGFGLVREMLDGFRSIVKLIPFIER